MLFYNPFIKPAMNDVKAAYHEVVEFVNDPFNVE